MASRFDEIRKAEQELDDFVASLNAKIHKIQTDASALVLTALTDAEPIRRRLTARLTSARIALAAEGDDVSYPKADEPLPETQADEKASDAKDPKPSAREIMLTALAESGPISASHLDKLVEDAKLKKSAAVKARQFMKQRGEAKSEKRMWSITEVGTKRIRGSP